MLLKPLSLFFGKVQRLLATKLCHQRPTSTWAHKLQSLGLAARFKPSSRRDNQQTWYRATLVHTRLAQSRFSGGLQVIQVASQSLTI